jgi:hypothetical protein
MKPFFIVTLLISIVFPFFSFVATMRDFAHNQWKTRHERLANTTIPKHPSAHLGLTAAQLTGLDNLVADAYKDAVYDGHRTGRGYQTLWFESILLDGLVLVASLVGLRACRRSTTSNQSLEPTAGRPG